MMVIKTRREVVWITSEDLNLTKSIKVSPTDGRKLSVDWIQNKNSIILVYAILYELRNGLMEYVVPYMYQRSVFPAKLCGYPKPNYF